jgi:hypothetical protein
VREDGILEDDDPPDEVEALLMDELRRRTGIVEVARRAHASRLAERVRHKPDLPVLVLDVELDRGQAVPLEADVFLELARDRSEAHRHVDAADLHRERSGAGARRLGERRGKGIGLRRAAAGDLADELGSESEQRDAREQNSDQSAALDTLPASCRSPALSEPLVRVEWWKKHRHRGKDLTSVVMAVTRSRRD